jgi:hypothetical protein
MTETEREILTTLNELEAMVNAMKTANPKPNLLPIFDQLESLTRRLGRDTDPSLLHYLHKKSYEKARLHLEGRDAENTEGARGH